VQYLRQRWMGKVPCMPMLMTTLGGVASEGSVRFRASPFMKGLTAEMPLVSGSATQLVGIEEAWQTTAIPQSITVVVTVGEESFELSTAEPDIDGEP
jgi:hypothetical protein